MPPRSPKTTGPAVASSSVDSASVPPGLALIIVWSLAEPHRVGQVAPLPYDEELLLGRGDGDLAGFVHFFEHRPGVTPAIDPHEEILAGASISARHVKLKSTGASIKMERIGRHATYVNGEERDKATLRPGDLLELHRELLLLVALRPRTLVRPSSLAELHAFGEPDADGNVGESPEAWTMRTDLARAAATDDHVLVQGESGAGKELAVGAIRRQSSRAHAPFVACNAAAFPRDLLEAELFGNLANYPQAGIPARKGVVGTAHGGIVYLDEVGELPLEQQGKLLRAMESGEYRVLGEAMPRRADIRVVAATNRGDDVFRSDFLARFKVRVHLPPLRQRREDIALLTRHLLRLRAAKYPDVRRFLAPTAGGRLEPRLSVRLADHLLRHPLLTNVRELEAILIRSIDASEGDKLGVPPPAPSVAPAPVPSSTPSRQAAGGGSLPNGAPSKELVVAYLEQTAGNVTQVSKAFNLSRAEMYRVMEGYGIDPEAFRKG
jgi:DNA-binding NtrC family response regulator